MSNAEMIDAAMKLNGITEPCHTYAHWKTLGYQVKKGSKALFKTTIWKCTVKKSEDVDEEEKRMFMRTASFFGLSQVEAIA